MAKQKPSGWLDKFDSTVAKTDATRVNKQLAPLNAKKVTQKELDNREVQERKNRIAVSNAVQPYMYSSPKNFAVATSAIGDKLRFSEQPNVVDDYFNPAVMFGHLGSGLGQVPLNIQEGNYGEAAMNIANPAIGGAAEALLAPVISKGLKSGKKAIDQNFTQVGKQLAQIEKKGIAKGLSPQQIKNQQMQQVGITSLQREGYVPGVSEIASEYITPYSYDKPVQRILDIPRRIVTGEKNSKNLSDIDVDFIFDGIDKGQIAKPRYDAWRMYSGLPQEYGTFRLAETSPINHPSYSTEQLSGLEKFSLNDERKLLRDLPSEYDADLGYLENSELVEALPELKNKLKEIQELKAKGINNAPSDFTSTGVMGGYNRRFFDNKMEYNDIWDLNLNGTNVDKYFGKPFMSHGQLDYSFKPAEDALNRSIKTAEYYQGLGENIKKPKMEFIDANKKFNNLKPLNPKDVTVNKKENGGWLEKYNDGGPVQENYNDYSVSAPEGYVGVGTFNEGRDYSPAWGGQFQMGGELPNVTVKGKKKQPVYVTDKNDPKLKAYSDSLRLYNMSKDTFDPKYYGDKNRGANWYNFKNYTDIARFEKSHNIDGDYSYYRSGKFPGKIQPTSVKDWGEGMMAPVYMKPTQPVVYQERVYQTETPELQDLQAGLPVDISLPELYRQAGPIRYTMGKPLFPGGPQTDYYTPIDEAGNVVQSSEFKTSQFAMGGSLPGAVGFMYARTNDPAPSNGKYAKKTMASAQNGMEMRYYQNGLDFEPKGMGKNGKVIKDDRGQWAHPGEITEIGSNQITMQGVPYPVLGISDTGDTQMMYPDQEYEFIGDSVTEYPMMKQGGQLTKLDQLLNFTNYNTKQPGGWLDKYQ
jgi:hypothetical protein